jgi:hypothetical protein
MRFVSARRRVHPLSLREARLRVSEIAQLHGLLRVPDELVTCLLLVSYSGRVTWARPWLSVESR